MGLFSWFKGAKASPTATALPAVQAEPTGPTEQEVFQSPELLAHWVGKHVISAIPLEQDYGLLPDADARKDLEITPEQRDRCLMEYSVLRVAGVGWFIKQHRTDDYYLRFMDRVMQPLLERVQSTGMVVDRSELRKALESYVDAMFTGDIDACANQYLTRLYDDNSHLFRMKFAGIGFVGQDHIIRTYEVFRNAYSIVTQGMSYETLKTIMDAVEQVEKDKSKAEQ